MKKNITGNALIFSVVITTIVAGLIGTIGLYTYSIYYRVLDIKSQVYLNLIGDSLQNKLFIDYLTDPINNLFDYKNDIKYNINLDINKFIKLVDRVDDKTIPGKTKYFFLVDFDLETKKQLNKISKMMIYYKKSNESNTGSLNMTFVKYDKILPNIFNTGKVELTLSGCISNTNTDLPEYECQFGLQDFGDTFRSNKYDYLMFFKSDYGISYTIQALDINNNIVKIPSRYLEQDFEVSSYSSKVSKNISSKIDLYDRFYLNINKSLYLIE